MCPCHRLRIGTAKCECSGEGTFKTRVFKENYHGSKTVRNRRKPTRTSCTIMCQCHRLKIGTARCESFEDGTFKTRVFKENSTMAPKLYVIAASPPVRAVQLCASAIDLKLEQQDVNLLKMEHLKPEYLKINPQHTVPSLDDNGFILWDSHAIMTYLINKYGKDDSLYPKEAKARGLIDQRLFFDAGTLFPRMLVITKSIIFQGVKSIPKEQSDAVIEAYGYVENYLEKTKFVAGNNVTIADFSLVTTVTSCDLVVPIDATKFPKIAAWIKKMEQLPYYDVNKVGLDMLRATIKSKLEN
ncbi:unnamed protein product [Brassicogethes aeneus]|uniref:Uncharacterized protein n=1 Tax=Brassicogethes aeneus TaxID=1431903 RepID=A0A9P0AQT6_BRAAE|nr:unnamed protein product [Brassicogethes aeneus]